MNENNASPFSQHGGWMVYHCRRCDTHVSISADKLGGRDITKLCLCGQGTIVSDEAGRVPITTAFSVKPRKKDMVDEVIDRRHVQRNRTEWTEAV